MVLGTARWGALYSILSGALAWITIRTVLEHNAGEPGVPLDDSYIHFQYARALSSGHPFEYTPDAVPTPGATSLLWPAILSPFAAFESPNLLVWAAWAIGWVALAALAYETLKLAEHLATPMLAGIAGLLVVVFGGFAWFATSGMEVVPFAWLLARTARRSSEWVEQDPSVGATRALGELVALAAVCPLMRPEGVLGSLIVALALFMRPFRARRAMALVPLACLGGPLLVNLMATGQAVNTTATAKWLALNPYYDTHSLLRAIGYNAHLLFFTLLNGELWTALFIPAHGYVIAWCALPALLWAGHRRGRRARSLFVLLLALGALVPTTYETFLVNRVRYLWPFAPAWFVGLVALCDALGDAAKRVRAELSFVRVAAGGALVVLFARCLEASIGDVATSTRAITLQQVSLGRWANAHLPVSARIGLNDTGAIAFFGGRRTFDVVGLTTQGEARYWTAGPGSRFEHYERLPDSERPTHFIVYPEWFGIDALLGHRLAERVVSHTILGGSTMAAYEADWSPLHSADKPLLLQVSDRARIDTLDVADLESEEEHGYALLDGTRADNTVFSVDNGMDGGRLGRTRDRFWMDVKPGGLVVARWWVRRAMQIRVWIDDRALPVVSLGRAGLHEIALSVPAGVPEGRRSFQFETIDDPFASLHYWSFAPVGG